MLLLVSSWKHFVCLYWYCSSYLNIFISHLHFLGKAVLLCMLLYKQHKAYLVSSQLYLPRKVLDEDVVPFAYTVHARTYGGEDKSKFYCTLAIKSHMFVLSMQGKMHWNPWVIANGKIPTTVILPFWTTELYILASFSMALWTWDFSVSSCFFPDYQPLWPERLYHPQILTLETLISNVMVLGGAVFRR